MSPGMRTTARWRRAAAAVAAALVACLGTVLITDGPALAHGQFVRSDPPAGSEITTELEAIYLYFTEKPTSNAYFAVTAPSGVRVDRVWTHGPSATIDPPVHEWYHESDGDWVARTYNTAYSAQIPIAYWPETGDYTVEFLSVATDGQPVRGKITFRYTGPTSELPANYSPQRSEPDPNLLAVAPPGAPTAPPTGPGIEEVVAQLEAGPNLLILWIPIGIVTAAVIAAIVYWRMRPEQARELVISRFGGRYAAVTQRRPLALPAALSERLPIRRPDGQRAISSAPAAGAAKSAPAAGAAKTAPAAGSAEAAPVGSVTSAPDGAVTSAPEGAAKPAAEGAVTSVPRSRGPVEEKAETAVPDPAEAESSRQEP